MNKQVGSDTNSSKSDISHDVLQRLADIIESRQPARGGDPQISYIAQLFSKGDDAILKKIGEEAAETIMAAKDIRAANLADIVAQKKMHLIYETADLWFHSLIMLAQFGLRPEQVLTELTRREGLSGLDEQAARKLRR